MINSYNKTNSFFFDGATARGGSWPPLQYASRPLDPLLCLSIRLFPSFSVPWTRHPAISFLVFLFVLWHTAFHTFFFWNFGVLHSFYVTKPSYSQVPANCPYPDPARSSPYPHIPLPEIHPNIIHPSRPRSPQWSLPLRFPHQNPLYASPLPHTRYMPRLSPSSRFYHPNNIG